MCEIINVGKRLKEARETLKLTQKNIADRCNLTVRGYLNYESGKRATPSDVLNIFLSYGINTNWLLTGKGSMFLTQEEPTDEAVNEVARLMTNMDEQGKQAVLQTARQAERIVRLEKKLAG